ncbi:flagellar motor switch protein FliG [Desulfotalea psychrophila]|uniref:Flagellar motor switch protein FliG n=1 Tax=Desulfotalea psychrophila (strain LSv54 / DSM 12343) TaxID=177439 RepID=Q6AJU0_DESPS|nr:flagellar motor switch protein FliG [Desulfotalea psychrophila]CAG37386.1 related to flagellar motor switch protein (FliG) [Desulfotalea psychrophila LSv54]
MSASSLTGIERVAILLLCLGEEPTAQIFSALSDEEIHLVTQAMGNIEHIPQRQKEEVLQRFHKDHEENTGLFVKGREFVQNALAATPGKERSSQLLDQFIANMETRSLETIAKMNPQMVAGILEQEHPQTVALVLSTQTIIHSSEILASLSEEMRTDVVYRIAKLEKVSPEVINRIEDALHREIGLVSSKEQKQVGGIDAVVSLLHSMKNNLDADILESIEETDPVMAEEIRKRMFTFEDMMGLDSRALQAILREINNDSLTLALKTSSEPMREKIFANMSERAADMIKDDLEAMGPVRLSEVEAMQQTIVKIAIKLEEEGKIILGGGGSDELV